MTLSDMYLNSDIKTTGVKQARIKPAIDRFGMDVVASTLASVALCDPDAAHTAFEDMEMEDNASCVAFLFFEEGDDVDRLPGFNDLGPNGPTGHGDVCMSDADDGF